MKTQDGVLAPVDAQQQPALKTKLLSTDNRQCRIYSVAVHSSPALFTIQESPLLNPGNCR